jgi:hypothetical protein
MIILSFGRKGQAHLQYEQAIHPVFKGDNACLLDLFGRKKITFYAGCVSVLWIVFVFFGREKQILIFKAFHMLNGKISSMAESGDRNHVLSLLMVLFLVMASLLAEKRSHLILHTNQIHGYERYGDLSLAERYDQLTEHNSG